MGKGEAAHITYCEVINKKSVFNQEHLVCAFRIKLMKINMKNPTGGKEDGCHRVTMKPTKTILIGLSFFQPNCETTKNSKAC